MANERQRRTRGRHARPDAIERLYVYWLVSTCLLLLITVVLALFLGGALRRERVLVDRVDALEHAVRALQLPAASAADPRGCVLNEISAPLPERVPEEHEREEPTTNAPRAVAPDESPPSAPEARVPTDAAITARVSALLAVDEVGLATIVDPARTRALCDEALGWLARAQWHGQTWADLALVARLASLDAAAEAFERRAVQADGDLHAYCEASTRAALGRGQHRAALRFARRLAERTRNDATADVLLADALLGAGETPEAVDTLMRVRELDGLLAADRLRLARMFVTLERWPDLGTVLDTIDDVPERLIPQRDFLIAVSLIFVGRMVEAVGILDFLEAELTATPARVYADAPDLYDVLVWKGVALTYADELDAARTLFDRAAELAPDRPLAGYRRAILEALAGKPETAIAYLENVLAGSPRLAPAWEALASLKLDADEIDVALGHLGRVIELSPRRASAHFLVAIAHARVSRAEEASSALWKTFRLDPEYLAEAKEIEVLRRIFSPEELDALALEAPLQGGVE